jgi:hypothetical protein
LVQQDYGGLLDLLGRLVLLVLLVRKDCRVQLVPLGLLVLLDLKGLLARKAQPELVQLVLQGLRVLLAHKAQPELVQLVRPDRKELLD